MVAAAALGTVVVGGATAGDGGGNPHGTPPGQGGTPPGQAGTPPGQVGKTVAPGQAKSGRATANRATKGAQPSRKGPKPKASVAAKPKAAHAGRIQQSSPPGKTTICHRTGSETNPWVLITVSNSSLDAHRRHGDMIPATSCPAAGSQQAGGSEQDKVTICHRTSSETNPYVVITIARAGWENGHSKHEGDRILQPGDDPEQLCRQGAAPAAVGSGGQPSQSCPTGPEGRVVLGVWHKTGSRTNPYVFITPNANSAHYDASKHPDDIVVYGPAGAQTAGGECLQASGSAAGPGETRSAGRRGVAGVVKTRASDAKPSRGVLGATASRSRDALRGRLPFTGLPLWLVLGGGLILVASGLALRRTRVRALR